MSDLAQAVVLVLGGAVLFVGLTGAVLSLFIRLTGVR